MPGKIKVKCYELKPTDLKLIERLAGWYKEVWGIPEEITKSRLTDSPNNEVLAQLILKEGNKIISTGGLYHHTSLSLIFPKYKALSPWITQLYTVKEYRGKGYGALMLQMLEEYAASKGITQVYLLASSAQKFYMRNGYEQIERLKYKGADTAVMEKVLLS